jgi:hypothetical protein
MKSNGHKAVRADDLRTNSGRGPGERRALKRLRALYIADHPELSLGAIRQIFRTRGWVSDKTSDCDVDRGIERTRNNWLRTGAFVAGLSGCLKHEENI